MKSHFQKKANTLPKFNMILFFIFNTNKDTLYFKPKNLHNYQYFLGVADLILLNGSFL